jgi:hypothetical protein
MKTFIITIMLIASGCVSVKVDESQVCKPTQLDIPGVLITGNYTIPASYHVDLSSLDILDTVTFLGGTMSGPGLVDVSNVMIDINQLTLFNSDNSAATSIIVPSSQTNLSSTINSGSGFDVTVTLSGVAPASPQGWTLDTNFCFGGTIDRSYGL